MFSRILSNAVILGLLSLTFAVSVQAQPIDEYAIEGLFGPADRIYVRQFSNQSYEILLYAQLTPLNMVGNVPVQRDGIPECSQSNFLGRGNIVRPFVTPTGERLINLIFCHDFSGGSTAPISHSWVRVLDPRSLGSFPMYLIKRHQ